MGSELDKNVPEANGVDNEDSINLTIGEDEEKLLAEEVGLWELFCNFSYFKVVHRLLVY